MRLQAAAKFFDTCPVYDAYTGALLFKAQASTFLESSTEGSTSARRVVSLAPDIVVPSHSCVMALGQILVLGGENPDEWGGATIRRALWTKRASDSFRLLTPAQAVAAASGQTLFGQKQYLRESLNQPTDSSLDPVWTIYMSASIKPAAGQFLRSGSTLYRVRSTYEDVDGFTSCLSDELDEGPCQVALSSNNYNPVPDSYDSTTTAVPGLCVDFIKAFSMDTAQDAKLAAGDLTLLIAPTNACSVGSELTISGSMHAGRYRILSKKAELDAASLHIRRV